MNALDQTSVEQYGSACGVEEQESLTDAIEVVQHARPSVERLEVHVPGVNRSTSEHDFDRGGRANLPFFGRHWIAAFELPHAILRHDEQRTVVHEHREKRLGGIQDVSRFFPAVPIARTRVDEQLTSQPVAANRHQHGCQSVLLNPEVVVADRTHWAVSTMLTDEDAPWASVVTRTA